MNKPAAITGIYRPGGPTHTQWLKDLHAVNKVIADNDALVHDPEDDWTGVDPSRLPTGVADHYSNLVQLGYWHGWINASAA
ncbi:hypothetical protein [Mycolicibacterium vanbaalenii]|nr:hypothetical protein [Mycolicibacterium vanbaalenii]